MKSSHATARMVFFNAQFFLALMAFFLSSSAVAFGLEGDKELLKEVLAARAGNIGGIKTWRGRAVVYATQTDSAGVKMYEIDRGSDFILDAEAQKVLWRHDDPSMHAILRSGDIYYDLLPRHEYTGEQPEFKGKVVGGNLDITEASDGRSLRLESYDPMHYLSRIGGAGLNIDEMLTKAYNNAGNERSSSIKVSKNDNLVIVEKSFSTVLRRTVFDLSKGGNVVEYHSENSPDDIRDKKWTYEETGGVWILRKYDSSDVYKMNSPEDGTKKLYTTIDRVEFFDNAVNAPVDPSEFSLESLGVEEGYSVTDRANGIRYKYGDIENATKIITRSMRRQQKKEAEKEEMIEEILTDLDELVAEEKAVTQTDATEPHSPEPVEETAVEPTEPPAKSGAFLYIIICAVIVAIIVSLLAYRRYTKKCP